MEIYKDYPGLTIYDGFEFDRTKFGSLIVAEIDELQYWRDKPIFLRYLDPVFGIAQELTKNPADYLDSPDVKEYLDAIKAVAEGRLQSEANVRNTVEKLEKTAYINEGENLGLDIPEPPTIPETLEIKDADGNIIKTISVDMGKREYKMTNEGPKAITLLGFIPDDFNDDMVPQAYPDRITSLSDSYIKDKLWITYQVRGDLFEELSEDYDPYVNTMKNISDTIPTPEYTSPTEIDTINENIAKKLESWYGIPLINLSPPDTPAKDSIILHVDTKKDWTIGLTNLIGLEIEENEPRIDKTIPPNTRFMAAVSYQNPIITIYLKIEGDPTLYEKAITLKEELPITVTGYGADNEGLKTLCGTIYDFYIWETPTAPVGENPEPPLPPYPPDGYVYDGGKDRVQNNLIYPVGNWVKPATNCGGWFDAGDWVFIENGCLTNVFCRYSLLNENFTIMWYHYQMGYPKGVKTLVSDNIYNNYIKYDFDNFELIIDWNNTHYREYITLPEFLWGQFSVRYRAETNELTFAFRDFFNDRYEEISLETGDGFEFELGTLFGTLDDVTKQTIEILPGYISMTAIQQKYLTDEELLDYFKKHKLFLGQYDPREMLYEQLLQEV